MARPRGDRWQTDVTIKGKRVRKSFRTQEEAEGFEQWHNTTDFVVSKSPWSRARPKLARREATLETFASNNFQAIWGENRRPGGTQTQLRALYRVFGGTTSISLINTTAVDFGIAKWRREGLAASTINHRLCVLSKLLKYAQRRDLIQSLPHIQRQRVSNLLERTWSEDDEQKAFLYLDHINLIATKNILRFLLYTGARKGEAYALSRANVTEKWVHFDRRTTKNGNTREIPLVPQAKAAWNALLGLSDLDHPLEVVPRNTLRGHWELLRGYFSAVDDRAFVPHMLRHTCATRLVAGGVPLAQVMKWMGHQSIQVTMRYVYVAPKDLEFAAQVLAGERLSNR